MYNNPHTRPQIPPGLIAALLVVVLVPIGIVLAWLAWKFETLDPDFQRGILYAVFTTPFLIGAVALVIVWRWLGMGASIGNWFGVMQTWAQSFGTAGLHTIQYKPQVSSTTTEGELPALPALTLPDNVLLASILPTIGKGQLAYGMLSDDKPLILPMAAGYHILSHGDTRSGKTNLLDGLLVQLHYQAQHYPLRIIGGDFKRELAATWSRSSLIEAIETDPTTIAEMIEAITHGPDGILARYAQFEQLGAAQNRIIRNMGDFVKVTGTPLPLTFMVIDELNAVLEAADRKSNLSGALKIALQTGAGAGVYIAGGAQYLNSQTFGRDGSKQFVTRCHFGAFDPTAIRLMFGEKLPPEVRSLLTGQAGRGLIRTAGQMQPAPFQALHCAEDDILGAIRLLTASQPTMPRIEQQPATQQQPSKAAATATTGCQQPPDLAKIVARLRSQNMGKTKIIELVWGVKAGSNERYKVASAAYDQIVREP